MPGDKKIALLIYKDHSSFLVEIRGKGGGRLQAWISPTLLDERCRRSLTPCEYGKRVEDTASYFDSKNSFDLALNKRWSWSYRWGCGEAQSKISPFVVCDGRMGKRKAQH